jgi:predicted porin
MKKTLIALAAVAVSSAAMAQVTVSGSITAMYENITVDATPAGKVNGFDFDDSEVVFSFSEDLGGGMKASGSMSFENASDGAAAAGGGTILGLSGGFGSVVFSTKSSSDYLPLDVVTSSGFSNGSINDRVTFTSPAIMGARLSLIYGDGGLLAAGGTGAGSSPTNASTVYSLDYANGPLTANYSILQVDKDTHTLSDGGTRWKVGYDFGVAAVSYGMVNTTSAADVDRVETGLTVTAPVGSGITVGFSMATSETDGAATKLDGTAFSLAYALSKRSSITVEMVDYENATAVNVKRNRVKLNHSF